MIRAAIKDSEKWKKERREIGGERESEGLEPLQCCWLTVGEGEYVTVGSRIAAVGPTGVAPNFCGMEQRKIWAVSIFSAVFMLNKFFKVTAITQITSLSLSISG